MTKTAKPDQIDPLEILREEVHAAALCHGVERCEELAANLVERYARRLGGGSVYVRKPQANERQRIAVEIHRRHNGLNTRELAREFGYTPRQVQRIVAKVHDTGKKML